MVVLPYNNSGQGKKEQVARMFNSIAGRYDFLNHLLSFNIDRLWRKKAVEMLRDSIHDHILDVATGTGDFAMAALRLHPRKVVGVDISEKMLEIAAGKLAKNGVSDKVELLTGDAENLPFPDGVFDAALVGFGVRNFGDIRAGLKEISRVLNRHGKIVVLEFSHPSTFPFRQLYRFYSAAILPLVGKIVSGEKDAYSYLPESVKSFPAGDDFIRLMKESGFADCEGKPLTFGIVTIYSGKKAGSV